MFSIKREELIPELDGMAGSTAFLNATADAGATLLV
jgi:peroxiredoxin family protein